MCRPHGVATSTHCFLYHLRKQGEQRTMRCHFLNPSFVLFKTFFFFCPTGAFFSPPSPPPVREPSLFPTSCFFPHFHPKYPCLIGLFFLLNHHWFSQWNGDGREGGIMMTIPLPSLSVWMALHLPVKWLVWTRTGHQNESTPHPTNP